MGRPLIIASHYHGIGEYVMTRVLVSNFYEKVHSLLKRGILFFVAVNQLMNNRPDHVTP